MPHVLYRTVSRNVTHHTASHCPASTHTWRTQQNTGGVTGLTQDTQAPSQDDSTYTNTDSLRCCGTAVMSQIRPNQKCMVIASLLAASRTTNNLVTLTFLMQSIRCDLSIALRAFRPSLRPRIYSHAALPTSTILPGTTYGTILSIYFCIVSNARGAHPSGAESLVPTGTSGTQHPTHNVLQSHYSSTEYRRLTRH